MEKRVLCLLLVVLMGISLLAGCGGKENAVVDDDTNVTENAGMHNGNDNHDDAGHDNDDGNTAKGIQTVKINIDGENSIQISYDADKLMCDSDGYSAFFQDMDGEVGFSIMPGSPAQKLIEDHKGYEWMENYSAAPIKEQFVNGMLLQSFTETYTHDGNARENTVYCIPINSYFALIAEGDFGDGSIFEKAIVKVEGDTFKPLTQNDVVTLKDPSGKEVYKIYLTPGQNEIKLISNENGKAVFEYTSKTEEGIILTRPVEISVNAHSSGSAFFGAISGKYHTTYDPYEWDRFGGKYVYIVGFWDQKEGSERVQYQDVAFYLELPDGNLITGVCDLYQENAVYSFFDMGFMPIE